MRIRYEAMDANGAMVVDAVEAASVDEARAELRHRGLMVVSADVDRGAAPVDAAEPGQRERRAGLADLVLVARQMTMLLRSGAALVPSLGAVARETRRANVRLLLDDVRERVENGDTLSEALHAHPRAFRPIDRAIIAAGESTGKLAAAFDQLANLLHWQLSVRGAISSALMYPALLACMCFGVVILMTTFVLPRFSMLFNNLDVDLPFITQITFMLADGLRASWPVLLAAPIGAVIFGVVAWRSAGVREEIGRFLLRVPLVGVIAARLQVARMLRIWNATLAANVPLLDAIEQSREAVSNAVFKELLTEVKEDVSGGGRIGETLATCPHVPPVVASAIGTGEQNGRLVEAVSFVTEWIDEENKKLITNVTRLAEPVILGVMGVLVGAMAMALFMPLFEIAMAS